jgi:hypothetical protein
MRVLSATAPLVTFRPTLGGQVPVLDANTGALIGKAELVRGFAHYYGIGAHEGFTAIIGGGLEALRRELAKGIRNGRDDRS